ncbi:hypothetical protein BCV69DRAFT_86670 [Microstroma glucosiphilum]|uniref:Uncharacterized protein n=1 Tax=Pseudomicrostroma glucosiphilum TaxID=1684307 RepID=A0A316U0X8_9BASI|nr:hypothetical protein BCV69DRAFT_86670 [Pseudomicrostroma glucosiphilum]PWN18161.1 hypothetical protein BCV69DRAFT_86670 [Pseudomicrostroma glucosiphilum]
MVKRKRRQTLLTTSPPVIRPAALPDELLNIIVLIACQCSDDEFYSSAFDVKTIHSFALVSKSLYNLVNPFLYAHVRLTKPSDLLLYARTVSTQPSLATYTKTLWMGPDEAHAEVQDCWPLNKDCTAIKSSITEPMRLPHGVQVGTWWFFAAEGPEATSGLAAETRVIIQEACRSVGLFVLNGRVSLEGGGEPSFDGTQQVQIEARLKIYKVQQRLDAFLYEGRQVEGACQLLEYRTSTPLRKYDAFDRFDHPMVYDRSKDVPWNDFDPWRCFQRGVAFEDDDFGIKITDVNNEPEASEQPHQSEQIEYSHCSFESDEEQYTSDKSDDDQYSNDSHDSEQDEYLDGSLESARDEYSKYSRLCLYSNHCGPFSFDLSKVIGDQVTTGEPTLGFLIVISRVILARSRNLLSLAVTSYLQMAVCGSDVGPCLDRLYSLTVGPPARQYQMPLNLTHDGLNSVRRLRLWETAPSGAIPRLLESSEALPALERLECTWSAPWENLFEIEDMIEFETDAASASLTLLQSSDFRWPPRRKALQLNVWAHRSRMEASDSSDLEVIMDEPRLELKALPWEVMEFQGYQQRQRPRALARVRKQWEKECQEILALHPEELRSSESVLD